MTIIESLSLMFAVVVSAEAYRRTAPLPRAVIVLVVAVMLLVLWLLDHAGALRLG